METSCVPRRVSKRERTSGRLGDPASTFLRVLNDRRHTRGAGRSETSRAAPHFRVAGLTPFSRLESCDDAIPELLEPGVKPLWVERRRWERQPGHAQVLVAAHAVEIQRGAAGRDLDLARVPTEPGAFLAEDGEHLPELLRRVDPREEAVAVAGGAAGGEARVPADDDRHARPLYRLRVRLERRPAEELAGERLRRLLPERAQRAHRLGGPRRPVLERDAERLELLAQPADADAEDQ